MAAPTGFVSPSSRRARIVPENVPSAPPTPAKKRIGGPHTTGLPWNPETGVGLLAALVEPASARLRVARRPFRSGIRGSIRGIMAVNTDLFCDGTCDTAYCGNPRTAFRAGDGHSTLACGLCSNLMVGATVYMYMDKTFCSRDCRFDYFLEEVYDRRQRELAGMRGSRRSRRGVKTRLVSDEEMDTFRSVFFS